MSLQASAETSEFMEKVSCLRMVFWITVYQCLYNQDVRAFQCSNIALYLNYSVPVFLSMLTHTVVNHHQLMSLFNYVSQHALNPSLLYD